MRYGPVLVTGLAVAVGCTDPGPEAADYTLALAPTALTIVQGANSNTSVTITRTNFTDVVTLSLSGAPAGITGLFHPSAFTGDTSTSTLTVSVGAAVAPGVYNLTVDGTGSPGDRSTPFTLDVPSPGGFLSVSAGGLHTCGVTSSSAYCWGSGPLGDGSTASSSVPVAVTGGLTFSEVTAGAFVSCGLTTTAAPYCWGYLEASSSSSVPVPVRGGHGFSVLTIGDGYGPGHACGLTTSGAAYCWGNNSFGQVGDGTTSGDQIQNGWSVRTMPVAVVGGLSFAALTAGLFHTCGLTSNGAASCWGDNEYGQLGNGSTAMFSAVPVAVAGGLRFAGLSAGGVSTCGVTTSGAAYCWGPNGWGQLGDSSTANSGVPVAVTGGLTFSVVTTGSGHSCGLTTSGAAFCWGWNSYGQLGTGDATGPEKARCYQQLPCSARPVPVAGGLRFATLSVGGQTSCGIALGGVAYCWGDNRYGQVGDGTTIDRLVPTAVAFP
jgi:alpha-tubulin suppressor-like RCC1 family protein